MTPSNEGKASYFAFISHKSSDTVFALKLQKFIESYHLPAEIRRKTQAPKRLSPLCAYEVDFSSNPLMDEMRDKLKRSKYLLLICSEELLKNGTKYVNYEIRTFMECRREEGIDPLTRIIPIIVSGSFGSPDHDCCPEALKELGDNCPIALDRQKYKNDRELFLHAISGMLDIDYAVLEDRDKKRQRKRMLSACASLLVLLTAGIAAGEYYIPREYHYLDFVMKNGIPEGIDPLSESEYKKVAAHYVITERKHKVEKMEHVNAFGTRVDSHKDAVTGNIPAVYQFEYTSSGLSLVTCTNKYGTPYFVMQYSANSLATADFRDPFSPSEAYYIGSGYESDPCMLLADYNLASHSDISRFMYEYSEEGYVTKIMFGADSTGRLAQDNAVYGFEYTLDDKGRIIETYFLDAAGERRMNSEGIYCRQFIYDEENNLTEWKNLGRNGELVPNADGFMHMKKAYDENHNVLRTSFHDETGALVYVPSYGGAQQIYRRDEHGNAAMVSLTDENSAPVFFGDYCSLAFTYDENGVKAGETFIGGNGSPVIESSVHYSTAAYENDDAGRPLTTSYLDENGSPINIVDGYAKEVTVYNEMGLITEVSYFDADGSPADFCGHGYAKKIMTYDDRGRETSVAYYDGAGHPVMLLGPSYDYGYHRAETTYEFGAHTKVELAFYDTEGNLVNSLSSAGSNTARSVMYFQNGVLTSMTSYDKDGNISGNIIQTDIDHSPEAERIETYRILDSNKNLLEETITTYSVNGVISKREDFQYIGKTVVYHGMTDYYNNGTKQSYIGTYYDENGTALEEYTDEFDRDGRKTSESMTVFSDPENYLYDVEYSYHAYDILMYKKVSLINIEGVLRHTLETFYDENGVKCDSISTIYENGTKVYWQKETFRGELRIRKELSFFNEAQVITSTMVTCYDENGYVLTHEDFLYRNDSSLDIYTITTYHADGTHTTKTVLYDSDGNVEDSFENVYDKDGNLLG